MKLRVVKLWEVLRDSFWFLPSVMVVVAIGLSVVTVQLDRRIDADTWLADAEWVFSRSPDGARALLSTIASSMMTIASVTFSITIVALQLASSQFGPRLLRNFVSDRGNQASIGTFIATFTYCLLILRSVRGRESQEFVPHLSVSTAMLLALASLGVLIYFIHHAATSIQAERVIAVVSRELDHAINRLYPDLRADGQACDSEVDPAAIDQFDAPAEIWRSPASGYLQGVDLERLKNLAIERKLSLRIDVRPGKFCIENTPLLRVLPPERLSDELDEELAGCFLIGDRRTLSQDIEFAIDQLVEIAVRALSPGVNDPFTAVNCVDRLGAVLCRLTERRLPTRIYRDEQAAVRLLVDASTAAGLVDAACDQIRQAARENVAVTLRLLEMIETVVRHTDDKGFRAALQAQVEAIGRSAKALPELFDQEDAKRRLAQVNEAFDGRSS